MARLSDNRAAWSPRISVAIISSVDPIMGEVDR